MMIKINGELMYGDYSDSQICLMEQEMNKPKDKRLYLMGIEFSLVDWLEIIKELKGGINKNGVKS